MGLPRKRLDRKRNIDNQNATLTRIHHLFVFVKFMYSASPRRRTHLHDPPQAFIITFCNVTPTNPHLSYISKNRLIVQSSTLQACVNEPRSSFVSPDQTVGIPSPWDKTPISSVDLHILLRFWLASTPRATRRTPSPALRTTSRRWLILQRHPAAPINLCHHILSVL
jgi:hypothetical protein